MAALVLLTCPGCGPPDAPGVFVGESEHFRLFVDPDLTVPAGFESTSPIGASSTTGAPAGGVATTGPVSGGGGWELRGKLTSDMPCFTVSSIADMVA